MKSVYYSGLESATNITKSYMSPSISIYRLMMLTILAALLVGCFADAPPAQVATTTDTPTTATGTTTPAPTETPTVWTFPAGSRIAGIDVSGKTPAEAERLVAQVLREWQRPIPLQAEGSIARPVPVLKPSLVRRDPSAAQLVADAERIARDNQPVAVDWEPEVDAEKLRAELETLAPSFEQVGANDLLTNEESLTATFTFRAQPGIALDVDATTELLTPLLLDPAKEITDTVVLTHTTPERDLAELQRVLEEHLTYWKNGVGAIYVHDLETGKTLGINENTVFSGASVMKVPIMIYVYSKLGKLNEQQQEWMENVIINSDNLDANALLAAAAGGQGTEAALVGVNEMSAMLEGLGLKHTYQLIPYESAEWLIQQAKFPKGGPAHEGEPPYTAADKYLRTTPREMGELFVMLAQCADGRGPLLDKYGSTISEALCDEMMSWLERPHDQERMVAGIPEGVKVAHKGGWIDDMQSDVGIVSSPGGRYVAAIYIWRRDGYATNIHASPSPYLGDFSHTIYTFFNPKPIE